jgi:hypothetical protein
MIAIIAMTPKEDPHPLPPLPLGEGNLSLFFIFLSHEREVFVAALWASWRMKGPR